LAFNACGSSDGCPPGTVPKSGTCVPAQDNATHENVIVTDVTIEKDQAGIDKGNDGSLVDVESISDSVDESVNTDAFPGGVIGRPCKKDMDCKLFGIDGVCLDWPAGYCSILDCDGEGGECPAGSVCMALTPNALACAALCETGADCRLKDGYGCKGIAGPEGDPVRICYEVDKENGPAEGCYGHEDCAGSAACLTNFSGGYCAVLFCSAESPCDEGTACVLVNGTAACLKECESVTDCQVEGDFPRECASMKSAIDFGDKVDVCASGTLGVPIGGQCLNDMECDSEECEVVFTGKCSFSKDGCVLDSDCTDGGICQHSAEYTFGYCTKECSMTKPCKGAAFCIGMTVSGGGGVEGRCLPGCADPGDVTCRSEAGLTCLFGDPVGEVGHYACAGIEPGSLGDSCKAPSHCSSGQCLVSSGGSGYCAGPCGFQGFCPFPTSCQQVGGEGEYKCVLRCLSQDDCSPGFQCKPPMNICYP